MELQQLSTVVIMVNNHPDIVHTYVSQGLIKYPKYESQTLIKNQQTELVYIIGEASAAFDVNPSGEVNFAWAYSIFGNNPAQPETKVIFERQLVSGEYIILDTNIYDNPNIRVTRS